MATHSRMMDGLCLHLLSGRHSKIINKYTASFFCLCVLLSLFQNEHKDTQKIFSSTSTWSQTHSWGLYETSAHMHTLTHTKHSSKSSNAAEIFPPPLLYKAVSMATRSSFWHWRGESYRKYERPPRGGHGYCWRTELESLGFKRKAAVWGQISAECSIQCMVLINSS